MACESIESNFTFFVKFFTFFVKFLTVCFNVFAEMTVNSPYEILRHFPDIFMLKMTRNLPLILTPSNGLKMPLKRDFKNRLKTGYNIWISL